MGEARLKHLVVGQGAEARPIAVLARKGGSPGVFWLGGFRSDMAGAKAEALAGWAAASRHACVRFDYSGHGRSGGDFEEGTISRWLAEAEAVFNTCAKGRQILVGSSMGGWIALLLARRIGAGENADRLAGMVLIAPAFDMTKDLMWDSFTPAERRTLKRTGVLTRPSSYSAEPDTITRALIDDGERHLLGERPIETRCPVHILQGMRDEEVPWRHAAKLMERLAFDDAVLSLVRDGDHRLSRPEDVERLLRAVGEMAGEG